MNEFEVLESMDGKLFLMHSGRSKRDGAKVGSGRYPLGSGDRPYQNSPREGLKRMTRAERRAARKSRKHPTVQKAEPLTDEEKQQIISTGNIRKAYDNKQFLTNSDIDAVILRYTKEKNLADLLPKKKNGLDYVDKASRILDSSVKLANAGINAWNVIARVNNTFNDSQLKPIYAIGQKKDK